MILFSRLGVLARLVLFGDDDGLDALLSNDCVVNVQDGGTKESSSPDFSIDRLFGNNAPNGHICCHRIACLTGVEM